MGFPSQFPQGSLLRPVLFSIFIEVFEGNIKYLPIQAAQIGELVSNYGNNSLIQTGLDLIR